MVLTPYKVFEDLRSAGAVRAHIEERFRMVKGEVDHTSWWRISFEPFPGAPRWKSFGGPTLEGTAQKAIESAQVIFK